MIYTLILSFILELVFYLIPPAFLKKLLAILAGMSLIAAELLAINSRSVTLIGLLLLVGLFRGVNIARFLKGRMHNAYRQRVCKRTSLHLLLATVLIVSLFYLLRINELNSFLLTFVALQLVAAVSILVILIINLLSYRRKQLTGYLADKELPSVTVAIPARNETADLTNCLRGLIANDYPKLEILVLDDCSQDKTAEVIKSFAQDGVRFLLGHPADNNWLDKNFAYQQLLNEASGELILFCGVDTRFGPGTIREMVNTLYVQKIDMLSVLPVRHVSTPSTSLIQPLRYWWELVLPRNIMGRPAVLSTVWLIKNRALKNMGGFDAVKRSILPEAYFARRLFAKKLYKFFRHDQKLDVQTYKTYRDQRETAVRMRYPQAHKRPEIVLLLTTVELSLLLLPIVQVFVFLVTGNGVMAKLSILTTLLLIITHIMVVYVSNPANVVLAMMNFPVVIVTELILGIYSMYKYEFSEILWKDRNICIPVMHVYSHMPKLTDINTAKH
ncbi:MAG: glycosyltransferase [Patescibacteria group bacterium]